MRPLVRIRSFALVFVAAIVLVVAGWMRSEERNAGRRESQADAAMADIRVREVALAERLARERAAVIADDEGGGVAPAPPARDPAPPSVR